MQITCSNCQSKIRVPDSAAGKKGKCPKCGTIIAIPAADAPTEELPAGSPFDFGDEPAAPPPALGPRRAGRHAGVGPLLDGSGRAAPAKRPLAWTVLKPGPSPPTA